MNIRPSLFEPALSDQQWVKDDAPDSSLFLSWPEQDQLIKTVTTLLDKTGDIILISGPQGVGKTTLIYRLQSQLPDNWLFCRVNANPMLHTDQILQRITRSIATVSKQPTDNNPPILNDEDEDKNYPDKIDDSETQTFTPLGEAALTNNLYADCGDLRDQNILLIVLIDDADQLPSGTLKAMLRLHERREAGLPLFGLILLTEPLLEHKLSQLIPQNTKNSTENFGFQHLVMPRLTLGQMPAYVSHFLEVEEINDAPDVSSIELGTMHQKAAGVPGKINELIILALRPNDNYSPPSSIGHKLAFFFSGILIIGATGFAASQFPDAINWFESWLDTKPKDTITPSLVSQPLPLPTPSPRQNSTAPISQLPRVVAPSVPTKSSQPKIAPVELIPLELIPQSLQTDVNSTTIPQELPQEPPIPSPAVPMVKPPAIGDNDQLLNHPGTAYTLQLFAASDEAGAKRYIDRNKIAKTAFYVAVRQGNHYVYYVLQGIYPTKVEANTALNKLPLALRKKKPWPRSLGEIQSAMRK